MFITNIFMRIKQIYEYITFPSKQYAKKYSKQFSKKYVDEYILSQVIKTSPSISSQNYAGSNPPSCKL